MKFFVFNEEIDNQIKQMQARVKHLKSGEISQQLDEKGLNYKQNYGVTLVHLRNLSEEFQPNNDLADRLWHLGCRETRILASMLTTPNKNYENMLDSWAEEINNIELAEQMAFNLLGKQKEATILLSKWLTHKKTYTQYAALMGIGWQFRLQEEKESQLIKENWSTILALATEPTLNRAATYALKMAGRFDSTVRSEIDSLANTWKNDDNELLKQSGEEISFELEMI